MTAVVDRNGVELRVNQRVLVHQEEGTRTAVVVELFPNNPTVMQPGHWVDVNIDHQGAEGIPSYILEVVPHWRRPDDTSDELEVGDRLVAICRWSERQGLPTWRHVLVLTVQEDGPATDSEGLGLCLEDCDYWMPEGEFFRLFGPEVT